MTAFFEKLQGYFAVPRLCASKLFFIFNRKMFFISSYPCSNVSTSWRCQAQYLVLFPSKLFTFDFAEVAASKKRFQNWECNTFQNQIMGPAGVWYIFASRSVIVNESAFKFISNELNVLQAQEGTFCFFWKVIFFNTTTQNKIS